MSWSPLHKAAYSGILSDVQHLVESNADLGGQDSTGRTPLMVAIQEHGRDVSRYLADKMSAKSLRLVDYEGKNALHCMAWYGRPWLDVWTSICTKCPGLEQMRGKCNRPIDIVREKRDQGGGYRELYQLLEGRTYTGVVSGRQEEMYNITVTCVGHQGVGKTCLATNLKEETLPAGGPVSTNFGSFDINKVNFDPDTRQRQKIDKGTEAEAGRQRLRYVINKSRLETGTPGDSEQAESVPHKSDVSHNRPSNVENNAELLREIDQREAHEYRVFMDWLHECRETSFDYWFNERIEKIRSEDDEKVMKRFLARYSSVFAKKIYCAFCSSKLPTVGWYRCLQCMDTNLCRDCYKSGIKFTTDHDDDHAMIYMGRQCCGCKGIIMSTMMDCLQCYQWFCVECNHFTHGCKNKNKVDKCPAHLFPGRCIADSQFTKIKEVMDTMVKGKSGPIGFVSIYDFGGEKVFYNTHHCLLSSDMIFLLVFDMGMCLDPARERAGYSRIEFWLESIATYAADEAPEGGPPILLIGSHLDEVIGTDEEKEKKFDAVIQKLYDNPRLKPIIDSHVHGIYAIGNMNDSSKNKEIYDKIWDMIMDVAPLQSGWGKSIPARWLDMELELMTKKADGCNVMTFEELKDFNRKLIVPLSDNSEIRQYLEYVQLSGSMVVCGLLSSSPFLVLNFEVITKAFSSIITAPKFKTELSPDEELQWIDYQKSGILPINFLRKLWKKEQIQDLLDKEDLICFAMESYGLLAKPLSDQDDNVDYYVVPCMLEEAKPDILCEFLEEPCILKTTAFCIRFEKDFIPPAIWDKLLATCIHRFQPMKKVDETNFQFLRRGFACLCVDNMWKLIINCKGNEMKIVMFKENQVKSTPPSAIGVKIRFVLEYFLKQILQMSHQSHLRYDYYLHCDYRFTEGDTMVKAEELLKTSSMTCHGAAGEYILCKEDYDIWFKDKTQVQCTTEAEYPDLPVQLRQRRPSSRELGRICKYIGLSYQMFFVELECDIAFIEQMMVEYRHLSQRSRLTRLFISLCNVKTDLQFSHISLAMKKHGIDSTILLDVLDDRQQDKEIRGTWLSKEDLYRSPDQSELGVIAKFINNSYFNLFLELGLTADHIGHCEMDHRDQICHVLYKILLADWVRVHEDESTISHLLMAMKDCHMSWYEVSTAVAANSAASGIGDNFITLASGSEFFTALANGSKAFTALASQPEVFSALARLLDISSSRYAKCKVPSIPVNMTEVFGTLASLSDCFSALATYSDVVTTMARESDMPTVYDNIKEFLNTFESDDDITNLASGSDLNSAVKCFIEVFAVLGKSGPYTTANFELLADSSRLFIVLSSLDEVFKALARGSEILNVMASSSELFTAMGKGSKIFTALASLSEDSQIAYEGSTTSETACCSEGSSTYESFSSCEGKVPEGTTAVVSRDGMSTAYVIESDTFTDLVSESEIPTELVCDSNISTDLISKSEVSTSHVTESEDSTDLNRNNTVFPEIDNGSATQCYLVSKTEITRDLHSGSEVSAAQDSESEIIGDLESGPEVLTN